MSLNSTFEFYCFISKPGCFIFTTFTFMNILLLLPLCIFVLYHGLQQCQKHRSSSTAAMTTHSNSFTYHLVVIELIDVLGCILCCCGIYKNDFLIIQLWYYLYSITLYGETFFHLLTCVEHYLAVIHPITYLSLKKERWIRIRNISIVCIWLLCFGWTSLIITGNDYLFEDVCLLIISVIIISFCNLSVLYVLIRPGPGDQCRDRVRVDRSKQRAFYTIMAILGVLLLRCTWSLVGAVHSLLGHRLFTECESNLIIVWIHLPGSLVLPLLFIQRARTLACCR